MNAQELVKYIESFINDLPKDLGMEMNVRRANILWRLMNLNGEQKPRQEDQKG